MFLTYLFVYFVCVSFCHFSLPIGVGDWCRGFVTVAVPGLLYLLFTQKRVNSGHRHELDGLNLDQDFLDKIRTRTENRLNSDLLKKIRIRTCFKNSGPGLKWIKYGPGLQMDIIVHYIILMTNRLGQKTELVLKMNSRT